MNRLFQLLKKCADCSWGGRQPHCHNEKADAFYAFLDFDGVLHPDNQMDFSNLNLVEEAIRLANQEVNGRLKIVISSAWRYTHSVEDMRHHFSKDIAKLIIGATEDTKYGFKRGGREREIKAWIKRNDCNAPWVAIDDRKVMFEESSKFLVLCDGSVGFERENQMELMKFAKEARTKMI